MKILFTSPVLEHPAAGGPQLRIENSIKALSRLCDMTIISRSPLGLTGGEEALAFYRSYCRRIEVTPATRRLSANRYARKLQRIAASITGAAVRADVEFILESVRRHDIRCIWFGYGNISFPLIRRIKSARPDLKVVCDTDSVWSRFILRELPYASGWRRRRIERAGRKKEIEERDWVNLCDITTAVSEIDAQYYRGIAVDHSRVRVFSNVIDVATYEAAPPAPPGFRKPCMYLAGTFGHYHSPMDTAARWVLDEVLPLVQRRIPDIHFYIVGTGSERMLGHRRGPNVTVTGKLPSVLPYLCNANVALVPLKFESGTRFKILEAGACGVPLVSTTLGAEGIPVTAGKHILLADSTEEFAGAVVRLIEDRTLATSIAHNCKSLVHEHYSVDTLTKQARTILESLRLDTAVGYHPHATAGVR